MAKKKTARTAEEPAKPARTKRSKLAIRVSDEERVKRGGKGTLFPISVFLKEQDLARLDAIREEICSDSRVAAARYAIKRWHRHLVRLASRSEVGLPARPELEERVSREGNSDVKIYIKQDDMDRLRHLSSMVDCEQFVRLIRAAIGWQYENLDA